jgi:hypothetical protein
MLLSGGGSHTSSLLERHLQPATRSYFLAWEIIRPQITEASLMDSCEVKRVQHHRRIMFCSCTFVYMRYDTIYDKSVFELTAEDFRRIRKPLRRWCATFAELKHAAANVSAMCVEGIAFTYSPRCWMRRVPWGDGLVTTTGRCIADHQRCGC